MTEGKRKAYAMILLTQMMFERCSNDVLLPQNDVRTRANLGMAFIIEYDFAAITKGYDKKEFENKRSDKTFKYE